jgi:hypothetical protein
MEIKVSNNVLWHPTGLRMEVTANDPYDRRNALALEVRSLNPETGIVYAGSRGDMIRMGLWLLARAVFTRPTRLPASKAAAPTTPPPPKPRR